LKGTVVKNKSDFYRFIDEATDFHGTKKQTESYRKAYGFELPKKYPCLVEWTDKRHEEHKNVLTIRHTYELPKH